MPAATRSSFLLECPPFLLGFEQVPGENRELTAGSVRTGPPVPRCDAHHAAAVVDRADHAPRLPHAPSAAAAAVAAACFPVECQPFPLCSFSRHGWAAQFEPPGSAGGDTASLPGPAAATRAVSTALLMWTAVDAPSWSRRKSIQPALIGPARDPMPLVQPIPCRLSAACFVCKRFRELCLAPELLRSMQLGAWGPTALPYGQSLQHFLEQHAQHVRRLTLHLQLQDPHLGHPLPYAQHLHDELAAAVAGCLAASAAASRGGPGLEELVLSPATDLTRAGTRQWLPRLPRLQVLWMG